MTTMESIRSVYVHGFTANIPVYENYVRAQERAEARFDKALSEYRDAVLSEAILALDAEFLTDNTGDPTDEAYNMALHDAMRTLEDLKGGA